jgi:PAS domain S-box-containing protein
MAAKRAVAASPTDFAAEIDTLFGQRTHICLWLGIVFFPLFSLLDLIYCRPFFGLFLSYRLSFVLVLVSFLLLLRYPTAMRHTRNIMFAAMLCGTLTLSLMTVQLGGFVSGYYVGILLMIAGGFSVLPLSVIQALMLGGAMYLVYFLTNYISTRPLDEQAFAFLINNSFFFFSILIVTTVQCYDEIQTQIKSLRANRNLQTIHGELRQYTENLENLVKNRMEKLEESGLKFHELYNTILDLVVLIDAKGTIRMVNHGGASLLEQSPDELHDTSILQFIPLSYHHLLTNDLLHRLSLGEEIKSEQIQMNTLKGRNIEVELSGTRVRLSGDKELYQLIIRDITATKEMERQVIESEQLFDTSRQAAILGLARLAECRDDSTGAHLLRIREYTRILATELAENPDLRPVVNDKFIEDICLSSVLHDIGKIGIPDAILLKPDQLSVPEFETMKLHCLFGSNALFSAENKLVSFSFLGMGQEITLYHHERWDGSGYPHGLSGEDIPLSARIVALADVYDALTSSRPYKPAYNHEQARMLIVEESGRQFDPTIVNAFLKKEQEFKAARRDLLLQANPQRT